MTCPSAPLPWATAPSISTTCSQQTLLIHLSRQASNSFLAQGCCKRAAISNTLAPGSEATTLWPYPPLAPTLTPALGSQESGARAAVSHRMHRALRWLGHQDAVLCPLALCPGTPENRHSYYRKSYLCLKNPLSGC